MILDMFMQGNDYRINQIKKYLEENNLNTEDLKDESILAEIITQKVLDINPLMKIYAQFLVKTMYDTELKNISRVLVKLPLWVRARVEPATGPSIGWAFSHVVAPVVA